MFFLQKIPTWTRVLYNRLSNRSESCETVSVKHLIFRTGNVRQLLKVGIFANTKGENLNFL